MQSALYLCIYHNSTVSLSSFAPLGGLHGLDITIVFASLAETRIDTIVATLAGECLGPIDGIVGYTIASIVAGQQEVIHVALGVLDGSAANVCLVVLGNQCEIAYGTAGGKSRDNIIDTELVLYNPDNPLNQLWFDGETVHLFLCDILVLFPPFFDIILDELLIWDLNRCRHVLQCQILSRITIIGCVVTIVDQGTLLDIQCGQFLQQWTPLQGGHLVWYHQMLQLARGQLIAQLVVHMQYGILMGGYVQHSGIC